MNIKIVATKNIPARKNIVLPWRHARLGNAGIAERIK